ncbi:MAG: putative glycoside hydrolase [Treponema sp.]
MTRLFALLFLFLAVQTAGAKTVKPLYKLPEQPLQTDDGLSESKAFLVGTDKGLFKISAAGAAIPLWTEGGVEQILRTETAGQDGTLIESWYFRTSRGIVFSQDLSTFELRNEGLPFLTVKKVTAGGVDFERKVHSLKDLCANPLNPLQMVTATKDAVYLTRDGGRNWTSIGSVSRGTSGIKAAAIASLPLTPSLAANGAGNAAETELVAFMSHPILGFAYIRLDTKKPVWTSVSSGFDIMKSLTATDEISDIFPLLTADANGAPVVEIYAAQTYLPRIYKFDWAARRASCIYRGEQAAGVIDGLSAVGDNLLYTKVEGLGALDRRTLTNPGIPEKLAEWKNAFAGAPGIPNSAWIPYHRTGFRKPVCLNELWLLYPGSVNTPYAKEADGKKSVYVSAYQCRLQSGIDKFRKVIKDNKLNSLVIDMKDDYGLLRYDSKDSEILKKAKITQYAVDLDHFVEEFKKDGVYLIGRIVTFKDRNLAAFGGGKYAVWNYAAKAPWVGIKEIEDIVDEETGEVTGKKTHYYDENWVDPYSPDVWEYNVAVAKELIARGFDEIQFDYIRFPTDGYNLNSASYRWKSEGMDKESALVSFLSYARENIKAPISIDIYGANGWYRSGTRTGQDVEMLAEYVDVIAPMFYPSHFEQSFLNYEPIAERSYRIYYYGTFRNTVMARNRVIVRPWAQAFRLNVSYDRRFYGKDYVRQQIFGVRDSVNRGYMYWNNSGDYAMISPDIGDDSPYLGSAAEAPLSFGKPVIGTATAPAYRDRGVSALEAMRNQRLGDENEQPKFVFTPFLSIPAGGRE